MTSNDEPGATTCLNTPQSAKSWGEQRMVDFVANDPHAILSVGHQRMYGLEVTMPNGERMAARKATRWLTNSPRLALALERKCEGSHKHGMVEG